MEYYIDRAGTKIHIGDKVQIVDRVRKHEGKNLDLVTHNRTGIVAESKRDGYVRVRLYKVHHPQELCKAGAFYPEELEIIESSGQGVLAFKGKEQHSAGTGEIQEETEQEAAYLESETPGWRISREQYKQLLSYIGCGNFPEADILFFGNEEGTGTYSIEANVEARCNTFGKAPGASGYSYIFGDSPAQGYWEPSALGGRDKIIEYLRAKGADPKISDQVRSSFLKSIARIVLALENHSTAPVSDWFEAVDSKEKRQEISGFALEGLFCPREGLQTALTDWRHLPRPQEGGWYDEYAVTATIENRYSRAYNQFAAGMEDEFSNYSEDAEQRRQLLLQAFGHSRAGVLIGLGGANGFKKQVLSHMFKVDFEPVDLGHGVMMNKALARMKNKTMHIYLLPFPSAQVYGSQAILHASLQTLVQDHLLPLVAKQ
ncbi:hypothetical protein [Paenibacillus sp. MMS20-IR301]|uniref:hypothetical protein n=1 Tax=Paenibacillus sp. MMS20-IR301 TaxID=2895946 RepID=UPI0028EC38D7|nr:hypothetical protein [Paenibacillus sp. MMS20-IR301]WNS40732.1 hypothetical protein LOS79_16870 [Paenibacillus sp. MMS20-IR301]